MNDEVPEGWAITKLGDLLEPGGLFDGPFGSSLKTADYTADGVRVIRLENLSNLRFVGDKKTFISKAKYESLRKHTVVSGDILFGSFLDGLPRVCLLPALDDAAIAKADCFCIRTRRDLIERAYLAYFLGRSAVRDSLLGEVHGATRPRITTKQLRDLEVALPPLAEQRRIVEKVEALLAGVNAARARLANASATLKRFRQSVLAAACSGRLTETWRSSFGAETTLATLPEMRSADLPAIPGEWSWALFGSLTRSLRMGTTAPPCSEPTPFPVLRSSSVRPGRVDYSDVRFLSKDESENDENFIADGDLLFTRLSGSLEYVANCARVVGLGDRRIQYPDRLFRARLVRPEWGAYLERCFESPTMREFLSVSSKSSAGHQRISMGALTEFPIPCPPVREQHEIVRRVDALFACAEDVEARVALASGRTDKLTQSILAKAFRGELVPTEAALAREEDREYESASALLERLRKVGGPGALGGGRPKRRARSRAAA